MSRPVKDRALPFTETTHGHLFNKNIFLIGNGKSRENFDLESLRSHGTIIGCNALYRDFSPDLLIAIDSKMINEIVKAGYAENNNVLVPANRNAGKPYLLKWRRDGFNTSGCFAMMLISEYMKPDKCYMLGMDSYPGNVYDKTPNYAQNTLQNFTGVSNYYIKVLTNKINETEFINVNIKDTWPKEATNHKYRFITYEQFENEIFGDVADEL